MVGAVVVEASVVVVVEAGSDVVVSTGAVVVLSWAVVEEGTAVVVVVAPSITSGSFPPRLAARAMITMTAAAMNYQRCQIGFWSGLCGAGVEGAGVPAWPVA